jgi:hypothetical protein
LSEYNYEHVRPKHLVADLLKTARGEGIGPAVIRIASSGLRGASETGFRNGA